MEDWRTQIANILSGDSGAAEQFFAFWHPRILRWTASYAHFLSPDADDIAQEVRIHLTRQHFRELAKWRGMHDDEANTEAALAGYLHRICENTATELRCQRGTNGREYKTPGDPLTAPDSDALTGLEGKALSKALEDAFGLLPDLYKHVLELRFIQRLSFKSIGARIRISPRTLGRWAHGAEMQLLAALAGFTRRGRTRTGVRPCSCPDCAASREWEDVAKVRLADDQLLKYLDGGEDDAFVAWMLGLDPNARRRLAFLRRLRQALAARTRSTPDWSRGPGKWIVRIDA